MPAHIPSEPSLESLMKALAKGVPMFPNGKSLAPSTPKADTIVPGTETSKEG
jgi:hypothetical protein